MRSMGAGFRRTLPALIGLVLFVAALEVLRHELATLTWPVLVADVLGTPRWRLAAAVALTAVNYAVLTGYDFLAFAYIGKALARWRVAAASFLAYAVANNVGFAMLSGASVRYRYYTRWGITAEDLSRIVFSYSVTFWLGLLALGGLAIATSPLPGAAVAVGRDAIAPIGWLLVAVSLGHVALPWVRHEPLRLGRFSLPLPRPAIAAAQLAVSALDWALAGAVFFVLLPPGSPGFLSVLGVFLAAQLLGVVSHVPGGVGVFEGLVMLMLAPSIPAAQLLPALVVYRAVYYLLPLAVALLVFSAEAWRRHGHRARKLGATFGRAAQAATPRLLAGVTFVAGAVLLFSGATPAAEGRLVWLDRAIPLGIIETSHFVGSLVGVLLLVLSHALARRLDSAYYLTTWTLWLGIAASLLKGADVEEALALGIVLFALHRARPAFDRRAALIETRFSPAWVTAVLAVVLASIWLGFFAFKHVEYSHDLWWQFEIDADVSRFLRASVGVSALLLALGVIRLMGYAPHEASPPSADDLAAAQAVIATQSATYPYLALLRDKALLFDDQRKGFVMYGVQGRTWAAMGDPVGPTAHAPDLIRAFLERCDDFGGTPAFYQVNPNYLHRYADFGLAFVKLGEDARVDLQAFTLEGGAGKKHRQAIRRLEKEGGQFRLVPAGEVAPLLDRLQAVSDAWLAGKRAAEKGFSLGYFDRDYLMRLPVAVIEREGEVVAFANVWPGPDRHELSVDLMRHAPEAPPGLMDALFTHLLAWGKAEGYRWFSLGMAPMSGFEQSPVGPLWSRLGRLVYTHGEPFYNFQGLRAYKEKFDPVWEPRYLAYPGGITLPRVLADIAALVAGGYRHVFMR